MTPDAYVPVQFVIAVAVGSTWGLADALSRPESQFRGTRMAKWGWVSAFAALTALFALSAIGIELIHAPYRLRDFNTPFFLGVLLLAVICAYRYLRLVLPFGKGIPPPN